jgi:hypothetical protein
MSKNSKKAGIKLPNPTESKTNHHNSIMATPPAPLEVVMNELKKIPMSKAQFDKTKARILRNRAMQEDPLLDLAETTKKCVQDIRERLAYIAERREQRALEEEQKKTAFATALAERNQAKETEKTTKQGQKTHRTRIEVWRDEVKHLAAMEKKSTSGPLQPQKTSRQNTVKRPLDSEAAFFEQLAGVSSTPINKRIKATAQLDSSSLVAPPTSSKKFMPWLSTRASMADEDIFADDDRVFAHQDVRVHKNKMKIPHEETKNNDGNDDDADEEINRDEDDANSEDTYGSELTQLEQMLAVEMAVVGAMTVLLPEMMKRSGRYKHITDEEFDAL